MRLLDIAVLKIQRPRTRKWLLLISEVLIVISAVIALLAVQYPGPIHLALFLVAAQVFIIIGILLYLSVAITDFLKNRGVSRLFFKAGETIFRQGDKGDFVYTIIAGKVKVVREKAGVEEVISELGVGQCFGEMALVSDEPRMATVRAVTDVEVMTMERVDFTMLYAYLPDLKQSIDKIMQKRRGNSG